MLAPFRGGKIIAEHQATVRRILITAVVYVLVLASCASAPVQEMSDARQALRAAENAGAPVYSTEDYESAKALLDSAEQSLESHDYDSARQQATDARELAIRARENASIRRGG